MDLRPVQDRHDRAIEIAASPGKDVLVPLGVGPVAVPLEQAVGHQRPQPRRQHVASDAEVTSQR